MSCPTKKTESHVSAEKFKTTFTLMIEADVMKGETVWSNIIQHDDCMKFFAKFCGAKTQQDLDEEFLSALRFWKKHYGISIGGWEHAGKMRRIHRETGVELRSYYTCPTASWHVHCGQYKPLVGCKLYSGGFHLHFRENVQLGGHYGKKHGGHAMVKAGSTAIWGYKVGKDKNGKVHVFHVKSLIPEHVNKHGYAMVVRRLYNCHIGKGLSEGLLWFKCHDDRVRISGRVVASFPGRLVTCDHKYMNWDDHSDDVVYRGYSRHEKMHNGH